MTDKTNLRFTNSIFRETLFIILVVSLAFFFTEGGCGSSGSSNGDSTSNPGELKWSYQGEKPLSSPAIGPNGLIYFASSSGKLHAIDEDNGNQTYIGSSIETNEQIFSAPTIYSDSVYLMYSGLYSFNLKLDEQWEGGKSNYVGHSEMKSSPSITSSGDIVLPDEKRVYKLTADDKIVWKFNYIEEFQYSSPAINSKGTIYVGKSRGVSEGQGVPGGLYAIYSNGTQKWFFNTGDGVRSSPAINNKGTIYFGCQDGYMYALSPDGTKKWSYKTNGAVKSSPVIDTNNTIYFGSRDHNIYALTPEGNKKWSYATKGPVNTAAAIGSDGTIYIGSTDDNLYALNPNGTLKWKFTTGAPIETSPAIDSKGTIYIGSDKVYAIHTNSSGLANTSWPMYGKNVQHQGNVNLE